METKLLKNSEAGCAAAARLLLEGCVVGIPTETVYGLAANALDPQAVKKIFEAKGRPQDNPLIVHIASLDQLELVAARVPEAAYKLAAAFWPGPLTMILPKSSRIPREVSAGLDTVGIRMPAHRTARRIIELSCPLAAPSANTSGKPSPTTAHHVFEDMNGRVPMIIDGGRCSVGVESTVVDMTGDIPRVLRPGAITEEMIAEVLGAADTDAATKKGLKKGEKPKSPGMAYRHYAPKAPITLYEGAPEDTFRRICDQYKPTDGIICFDEYKAAFRALGFTRVYSLGPSWDHHAHDRRLFAVLRRFDSTKARRIHAQCPREYGAGEGSVNRLRKSAGFVCVRCTDKQIVGLTGGTGSGKGLFCRIASKDRTDIRVIDTDAVYHGLLEDPQSGLTDALLSVFPEAGKDGRIDRKALAAIVFSDPGKLTVLNKIAHAAVMAACREEIAACPQPIVLLDVPLLFQSGMDRMCTLTVGLLADRDVTLRRIVSRDNLTRREGEVRIENQPRDSYYTSHCDLTLKNDGKLEDFEKTVLAFAAKYLD
ncbi:MAG: threonylcarbamoyl-AMP synthase [Clostridia bacterium]|nr:threonylcarbamoyl-AMP synthase [Clostridia bacterium]